MPKLFLPLLLSLFSQLVLGNQAVVDHPPQIIINSPGTEDDITAPTAIHISIADETLSDWRLSVRSTGDLGEGRIIATGTGTVSNAEVAELDPTLLPNGQYDLVLQAWDVANQHSFTTRNVLVTGAMKVGQFAFTVEDMNIPLMGLPIRISRTYNNFTRDNNGEMGYGWTFDYQNAKVQESIEPSRGWYNHPEYQTFLIDTGDGGQTPFFMSGTCLRSKYKKRVTVTLPDGAVERFDVRAKYFGGTLQSATDPSCYMSPGVTANLEFIAKGDTTSTLTSSDGQALIINNDNLVADIVDSEAAPITRYTLTTREGMKYQLDQSFGIRKVIDTNGNTLTYNNQGITHSAGESVLFRRDAQGRIIGIRYADETQDRIRYGYNSTGDLVSQFDELGNEVKYGYDVQGCTSAVGAGCAGTANGGHNMLSLKDPLNRPLLNNFYDDKGRLIAQEDAAGHRTEFRHDIAGRMESTTDRNGNITTHYYDDHGNVTTTINALGEQESFTYDANDNETSHTNAARHSTSATFNAKNDQLTQTDELGNTTTYAYNSKGQETQITDAQGNSYHNSYDANGNLTGITDPLNHTAANTINGYGLVTATTDVLGNITQYTYDNQGRKASETNALGHVTSYSYNRQGSVTAESRTRTVNGSVVTETTRYTYDAKQRVIKTIAPDGSVTRTEYDKAGNETASIDAKGRRTEMLYDTYSKLLATTHPDGTVESKTYDAVGNVKTETDTAGRTTYYHYDALNRVIATAPSPLGGEGWGEGKTVTEYDAAGNVAAEVDARGNRTEYEYDAAKRRTAVINALGQRHSFVYDAEGQLTSETDANGHTTQYEYNALGQKVKTIFHDNTVKADGLDAMGKRTAQTDQNGITTQYQYDALGRLITVITPSPLGGEGWGEGYTRYTYDEAGNKLTQTDAENRTTTWTYDSAGRVKTRTLPMGQTESFTYDITGNVLTHTDFKGQVTTNTYNPLNDRLERTTYADGSVETFTYTADGQVHTAINGEGTSTYAYDAMGRLATETKPDGSTLTYGYDTNGNRTTVTVTANGISKTTTHTFDALNRLSTSTDEQGTTVYSYDAVGNQSAVVYPNAFAQSYQYNALNRLTMMETQENGTVTERYSYTLDPSGKRLEMSELNGRHSTWGYDTSGRLSSEIITVSSGNHTTAYTFDKVGNRLTQTVNGETTTYAYDNNDRLLTAGNVAYSYDNNGNTLSETNSASGETKTYQYNAKNQMVAANDATYAYDMDGIRSAKTVNGVTTHYITDKNRDYAQVLMEVENGAITKTYSYGNDLVSQTAANESYYYLYDGIGSTRALVDPSGTVTDSYEYDAFGKLLNHTGNTLNNYLFTGEQQDEETGLYYLRARLYNPAIDRFTTEDPYQGRMQEPVTLHKYLYANGNPVSFTDPSGNVTLGEVMAAVDVRAVQSSMTHQSYRVYYKKASKKVACWAIEEVVIPEAIEAIMGGIYILLADSENYVGKTNKFDRRFNEHTKNAQRKITKTLARFHVEVDAKDIRAFEQVFIDFFRDTDRGISNSINSVALEPASDNSQRLRKLIGGINFCDD